jgi:hypothetical protein
VWIQVFPMNRRAHAVGPGIEVRENPVSRRREKELEAMSSME